MAFLSPISHLTCLSWIKPHNRRQREKDTGNSGNEAASQRDRRKAPPASEAVAVTTAMTPFTRQDRSIRGRVCRDKLR
ncbi:hypothetical protein U1Q18_018866 [Sarracenia purpurea var. burkii]